MNLCCNRDIDIAVILNGVKNLDRLTLRHNLTMGEGKQRELLKRRRFGLVGCRRTKETFLTEWS